MVQKLNFFRKESIEEDDDCLKKYSNTLTATGDMVSCFETSLNNLICFIRLLRKYILIGPNIIL